MAYKVYLGEMLLPVTMASLDIKINNQNDTINLIDETEMNILKKPGLTEIAFSFLLPNSKYPFSVYEKDFLMADDYLIYIRELKTNKTPFQFIVIRDLENGSNLFSTNMTCVIEDYTIKEDADDLGRDVEVEINLKQYIYRGTKTYEIVDEDNNGTINENRETANSPAPSTGNESYTVKSGDTLWAIAKYYYGDGSLYSTIYNANTDIITDPNKIYPGQVLTIPAV